MAKILMVIAPARFRDEELFDTKGTLESQGHSIVVASKVKGAAIGMQGKTIQVHKTLDDVKIEDFEAIIFVGGQGSSIYFKDKKALELAKAFDRAKKIVAAICIAPSILANAGLLKGVRATCFESESNNLEEHGAEYTGNPIEADGKIVTASGPKAAREFGKKIAGMLK
ncbi:MAG: DJ-1/PfpI family protein [Candidatus Diapherotrites archaeon]|nr:DJ-1/PfpI family protein [Candidatus Diapherotrites archaeon]